MRNRQELEQSARPSSVGNSPPVTELATPVSELDGVAGFAQAQQAVLDRFGVIAESRFIDVAAVDGRAHVLVSGSGPPVMMMIGGGIPAAMWAPLMERLKGFTLYAVDMPGFGLTDAVPYTTGSFRRFAVNFLEQVLDALGLEQPVFVSHSMGSLWTTWLAIDRPHRVKAMAQIACPALILGTSAPFLLRLLSIPPIGRLMMKLQPPSPKQVEQIASTVKEDLTNLPELRDLLLECERLPAYGSTWIDLLHAAIRLRGPRPELELTAEQLAQVTQPVQLIWGDKDPFGPVKVGREAADLIPDAEVHVVPSGHGPWFSRAEQIGAIATPFLQKHSAEPMTASSTVH